MGVPSFFRLSYPKKFNYSPVYWDPEKEEREDRMRRIQQEMGIETVDIPGKTTITRGSFKQFKRKTKIRASRSSNIRLLIILVLLLLISYFTFYR